LSGNFLMGSPYRAAHSCSVSPIRANNVEDVVNAIAASNDATLREFTIGLLNAKDNLYFFVTCLCMLLL
jgi:hypothetical protein